MHEEKKGKRNENSSDISTNSLFQENQERKRRIFGDTVTNGPQHFLSSSLYCGKIIHAN